MSAPLTDSAVGATVLAAVTGIAAVTDWTEIVVAGFACVGIVGAAIAANRGRRAEASAVQQAAETTKLNVNVTANNTLIDQLQETVNAQSDEIDRYRTRLEATDAKIDRLEEYLKRCQSERAALEERVRVLQGW